MESLVNIGERVFCKISNGMATVIDNDRSCDYGGRTDVIRVRLDKEYLSYAEWDVNIDDVLFDITEELL